MKGIFGLPVLAVALTVCVLLSSRRDANAYSDPPCIEYGPHTNGWVCLQAGAITNTGLLEVTNANVAPGEAISVPKTYYAGITTGIQYRLISYDCSPNLNHYETNVISYTWTNSFSPSLPASINTPGTNNYSVTLVGVPSPGSGCAPLTQSIGTYTVIVWPNVDSDYDGIMDRVESLLGSDPYSANSGPELLLGHWGFETNSWVGDAGVTPLMSTNLQLAVGRSGYGVKINSSSSSQLRYPELRTNGMPNINLARGAIQFWFKPDWSSTNAGGGGPQTSGRLIEVGDSTNWFGWWTLLLNNAGSQVQFITRSNGLATTNLTAAISWNSNTWYNLVLTYSSSNSALVINGQTVTNGSGVSYCPGSSIRSAGFSIGSDDQGQNQVKGTLDELATYNYAMSNSVAAVAYNSSTNTAAANRSSCPLRPIAIPDSAVTSLSIGSSFTLSMAGNPPGPGNFGWMTWNGDVSEPTLAYSLSHPNSDTYVNPYNGSDHVLNVGDWVMGTTGLKKGAIDALNGLINQQLVLPRYSQANGPGANLKYLVSGFIYVTLTGVDFRANSRTLTFTYNGAASCDQHVDVPPTVAFSAQAISQYLEGSQPQILDPGFQVADSDSSDFDGGSLTVSVTSQGSGDDYLTLTSTADIFLVGSQVIYQGNAIGTFSSSPDVPLVVSFSGSHATPAAAQAVMRAVTYQNSSEGPTAPRTIQVVANDGDGNPASAGNSLPATHTINIIFINHQPTLDPFTFQPIWQNGLQARRFAGVVVDASGQLTVNITTGIAGRALISGLQIREEQGSHRLLNIDFGAGSTSPKIGKAAIGISGSDFWNFYDRGWESVSGLRYSDGSSSAMSMTVQNGANADHDGSGDPMYDSYIYDSNPITLTLAGVPPGLYGVYVYGYNSNYKLTSGTYTSATQTTADPFIRGGVLPGGNQTITLTGITDGGDGGQYLMVQGASDISDITPSVSYSVPDTTGQLTASAAPTGSPGEVANITVTVIDSGGTDNGGVDRISRSAPIIIVGTPTNHAPTLSTIPNTQVTACSGAHNVALSGITSGDDLDDQTITVTAHSSNTSLIPDPTITYTPNSSTGTLTFTPGGTGSGTATITVTVHDNGGTLNGGVDTIQKTFQVTVISCNHPPTLDPFTFLPVWQAGVQFRRFADVGVGSDGRLTLKITPSFAGVAMISGLQVVDAENHSKLLNIDFGSGSSSLKNGKAAFGLTDSDFWNFYNHGSEFLSVMRYSDGSLAIGPYLYVQYDTHAGTSGSADAMYAGYVYDYNPMTLTLSELPPGQYDVYVYGLNSTYQITSGSDSSATQTTADSSVMGGIVPGHSQTITLTGITDGGDGGQSLTVQATSDNPSITPSVNYSPTGTDTTGQLTVTASSTASPAVANITVTVIDSGGDQVSRSAPIQIVSSSAVNRPPTLTTVQTLKATRENTVFPITYETLLAASDASDPDGDPILFRIVGVTSGTLRKSGESVQGGAVLLHPGETLTWTPPLNQNGSAMAAFTVVANDGKGLESSPAVQVHIEVDPGNNPPIVSAGDDINQDLSPVVLHGSATDVDGRVSPLTVWWTKVSGPGDATFVNPNDPGTTVTFSQPGNYVLRLFASDGEFTVSDDVNIAVCAQKQLPLDMIVLLDVSGSMTSDEESFAAAKTAITNLVARLHFTGGADTDKIGFIPIGDTGNLCDGNEEESVLNNDPASIQGYLDADYSSASSHEDFEPAIREAIAQFKQDARTRAAKPLLVFISDFDITRFEGGAPGDILASLAANYKAEGVRAVTLGFNLNSSFQRQWWTTLASSLADQFESDDVFGLPAIVQSVSTVDCQATGVPLCVFTPDNKTNQYQSGSVSFGLSGTVHDFRSVTEPAVAIAWTVQSAPDGSTVSFSPATAATTTVTIQNPVSEGDYVFMLSASVGGQESHDFVTVHLGDVVNNPPIARCDKFTVQEDSINNTLNVLVNDSDTEGDELYIDSVSVPDLFHGVVEISADKKSLLYTPDPNFNTVRFCGPEEDRIPESITYTIRDRANGSDPAVLTSSAHVQLFVTPINDPPIAVDDFLDVDRQNSAPQTLDVLANDSNPDDDEIDQCAQPDKGLTIVGFTTPNSGTLSIADDKKSLLYTHDPLATEGQLVTFTYTNSDPKGTLAVASVTVRITDNPINLKAVADDVIAWVGTKPIIPVMANDTFPAGLTSISSVTAVSAPVTSFNAADYFQIEGDKIQFFPKKVDDTGTAVPGTYIVSYTITASPLSSTAQLKIRLSPPGLPPFAKDDSASMDQNNSVTIAVLANDGPNPSVLHIQSRTTPAHGSVTQVTGGDGSDQLVYTPATGYYGPDSFTYTAVDPGGRTATATVNVAVYNPNSTGVVRAQLTKTVLTTDQQSALSAAGCDADQPEAVRDGVLNVTGIADDSDAQDAFSYDITIQNSDNVKVASFHGLTRVLDATPPNTLANIDLRAMPDGVYEVDLKVNGGSQTASDSKQILLQSRYKIGNLKFSELDATINVGGASLQVTRSYDSINASGGKGGEDFGAGWAYDLDDLHFEFDETREPVTDDDGNTYSRRSGGGRDISLILPDGREAVFAFKPRIDSSALFLVKVYAEWTSATPGVSATLTSDPEDSEQIIASVVDQDDPIQYWVGNSQASVEKYDLSRFLLTLPDGTSLHIKRDFEGAHDYSQQSQNDNDTYVETYGKARMTEMDTRTGERYFFSRDQVTHESPGQSTATPVMKIQRDPATHLISAIYDLSGIDPQSGAVLPNAQPVVVYDYDQSTPPRLIHVRRLREHSTIGNPIYDTTTYEYDPLHPNLIADVLDPRGVKLAKTTYDDQGRISRIEQPNGRWTEFHHDDAPTAPAAVARERIVDSEGNTTVHDTDLNGNILLTIDALQNQTSETYDALNNAVLTSEMRDALGNLLLRTVNSASYYDDGTHNQVNRQITSEGTGANTSQSVQIYDSQGNLTQTVDARHTPAGIGLDTDLSGVFSTSYQYSDNQLSATILHRSGSTDLLLSQNTYFSDGPFQGMLEEYTDAAGTRTDYSYYDGVTDPQKGRFGDVKSVTATDSANNPLNRTEYEYDLNGNRTKEIRDQWNGSSWAPYSITQYIYDGQGRIKETIDAEGGHSYTTYDADGRVVSSTDRFGATTQKTYDAVGDLIQTQYPDNTIARSVTYYQVESAFSTKPLRHVVNEDRHAADATSVNGSVTIYDELGRSIVTDRLKNLVVQLAPDGLIQKAVYVSGVRANTTASAPHDTVSKYDGAGRATMTEDAAGHWTKTEYDDKGRQWRTSLFVNQNGSPSGFTVVSLRGYNANGSLLWTLDPNQYNYFSVNNPSAVTGDAATAQSALFDDLANRTRLTWNEFDDLGHQIKTHQPSVDGTQAVTESRFDDAGHRWMTVDADGNGTVFVSDGSGALAWVITAVDPAAATALPNPLPADWFTYSWGARLPDSTVTHYTYDNFGRLKTQTDADQHTTAFEYDLLDRRTKRTLPDTSFETWVYDFDTATGAESTADPRPDKIRHRDFAGRYTLSVSDIAGHLISRAPAGREAGVTALPITATRAVSFTYTPTGQRATMVEGQISLSQIERHTYYVYDEFDRLRVKNAPEGILSYDYDTLGNFTEISARRHYSKSTSDVDYAIFDPTQLGSDTDNERPNGALMNYYYDSRNRLQTVTSGGASVAYGFDTSGNLKTLNYDNGVSTTFQYNPRNQLRYKDDGSAASFDYDDYNAEGWDLARKLTPSGMRQGLEERITFSGQNYRRRVAYDYDPLHRLRAERARASTGASWPAWAPTSVPTTPTSGDLLYDTTPGYGDAGGYDSVGNRRSRASSGVNILTSGGSAALQNQSGLAYDANDRLDFVTSPASYDANGNATYQSGYVSQTTPGQVQPDSTHPDEYDFENRLIHRHNAASDVTVVYDGDGNRVSKTVNSVTTRYLVDDQNPTGYAQVLEEQDDSGNPAATYVYGLNLVSQTRGTAVTYYGYDGQGSVRYLTDSSGTVSDTYMYDAYGILTDAKHAGAATVNNYLYAGQQWDSDLGMYYLRARYYKPDTGRFWTMDSFEGDKADPLSLHKYLYCAHNPVSFRDPSGHEELGDVLVSEFIDTVLTSVIIPAVVNYGGGKAVAALIPSYISRGLAGAINPNAFIAGTTLNLNIQNKGLGLTGGGGIEGLWSPRSDKTAVFWLGGGGLSFGTTKGAGSVQFYAGELFNCKDSQSYAGAFIVASLPFGRLPAKLRNGINKVADSLSAGLIDWIRGVKNDPASEILHKAFAPSSVLNNATVSFFWSPDNNAWGYTLAYGISEPGSSSNVTIGVYDYGQIFPEDNENVPFEGQ